MRTSSPVQDALPQHYPCYLAKNSSDMVTPGGADFGSVPIFVIRCDHMEYFHKFSAEYPRPVATLDVRVHLTPLHYPKFYTQSTCKPYPAQQCVSYRDGLALRCTNTLKVLRRIG